MLRRSPGERAAQITPAIAQFHRHQIVDLVGHALAGETDQDAAIIHEARDAVVIGTGDPADIGEHENRGAAVKQRRHRALAHIGIRRERAFEIEQIGEQRLLVLHIAGGDQADGAARSAFVEQLHRAGGIFGGDGKARGLVADFQRQYDPGRRSLAAVVEMETRRRQRFAVPAERCDFAAAACSSFGAHHSGSKPVCFIGERQKRQRSGNVGVNLQIAGFAERISGGARISVLDAVAEPENFGPRAEPRLGDGGERALAIGEPGFGSELRGAARHLTRVEQACIGCIGRGDQRHRAPVTRRRAQHIGDHRLALVPAMRRGPAIVDNEHERPAACDGRRPADLGFGQGDDQTSGQDQAQQQQPERRSRRGLFAVLQAEQESQRWKDHAPGRRRRDAQQEPDRGQQCERREHIGRAETQL